MREVSRKVSVAVVSEHPVVLPDKPHTMWVRDELRDFLHLPHDRTRVEIIGGEIVVSPGPRGGHEGIIRDIERTFDRALETNSAFLWETFRLDLNLTQIEEGYIPDLMVLRTELVRDLRTGDERCAFADQVEMVVEVTSRSNAGHDRRPSKRRPATKWTGYARVEIPYYLLVERDPQAPLITLFSVPDEAAGAYLHKDSWQFGETVQLEHFDVEIDTSSWMPWKD